MVLMEMNNHPGIHGKILHIRASNYLIPVDSAANAYGGHGGQWHAADAIVAPGHGQVVEERGCFRFRMLVGTDRSGTDARADKTRTRIHADRLVVWRHHFRIDAISDGMLIGRGIAHTRANKEKGRKEERKKGRKEQTKLLMHRFLCVLVCVLGLIQFS